MNEMIDIEVPEINVRDQNPQALKFDWIEHNFDEDIKAAEKALDSVKDMVLRLRRKFADAAHEVDNLRSASWKDKQLLEMKQRMDEVEKAMHRGFPISESENKKINEWMARHDTEVHNNPHQYHGASGGGYVYVFYPTGLGVAADCICSSCKSRSIKESGIKWYIRCKELGGVCEFQQFG